MRSADLIEIARHLIGEGRGRPRQADLRRAVSTAYYALFHAIARDAADLFVGAGSDRVSRVWKQVYRALEHGAAKTGCKEVRNLPFPAEIRACADAFVTLQEARHKADYDPDYRLTRNEALTLLGTAKRAIEKLKRADRTNRRAFSVMLHFKRR